MTNTVWMANINGKKRNWAKNVFITYLISKTQELIQTKPS